MRRRGGRTPAEALSHSQNWQRQSRVRRGLLGAPRYGQPRRTGGAGIRMNNARPQTAGKRRERGYALLLVIFLVTVLLISTMAIAPNILTEGQREKEKEIIWRGKQYTRGVKLYYRKMGRFPTSLDDLTKPKLGSLRFMRQAYKDPMNKEDGSWRIIYVGPAGQLIGSLKPPQTFQLPGQPGTPARTHSQPTASFGGSGLR